jgi:hypothetical protein
MICISLAYHREVHRGGAESAELVFMVRKW